MSSRHQPEHGADSPEAAEGIDAYDTTCDLCGRVVWDGSLQSEELSGTVLWRCGACRARANARYREMTT